MSNSDGRTLQAPNFRIGGFIRPPSSMGMSADGSLSSIGSNIGGLLNYIILLVTGGGRASKSPPLDFPRTGNRTQGPIGHAFFMKSGLKCIDSEGVEQDAEIYTNTIPIGDIPLLSGGADPIPDLRGLIPSIFEALNGLSPSIITNTLAIENKTRCSPDVEDKPEFRLPITILNSKGNAVESGVNPVQFRNAYMFEEDVKNINQCLFSGCKNPYRSNVCSPSLCAGPPRDGFKNITNNKLTNDRLNNNRLNNDKTKSDISSNIDFLNDLYKNDPIVQLYYISVTILFIFIIIKIFNKNIK